MSNDEIESLMQAQLKRDRYAVRDMARRLGVNYAAAAVQEKMTMAGLDIVEVAEFLARSVLKETFAMFGAVRHRVEPEAPADPDELIASATVCLHMDSMTIEIIAMRMKEEKS